MKRAIIGGVPVKSAEPAADAAAAASEQRRGFGWENRRAMLCSW